MKSILTFILATILLFPLQAQEKVYTVDNLPKVHLQNKMQYVCNPTGILSQAACDSIDSMLYALEQQTGIETVVAVVPSIGEEDCFNFCHQLLNQWGVGKKGKNNGLVILLVTDQRCIQFYTGYGLEGVLPDAICKRIQTKYMIPYLKDGNWNAGMVVVLKQLASVLTVPWKTMPSPIRTTVAPLILFLPSFALLSSVEVLLSFLHAGKAVARNAVNTNCREQEVQSYPGLTE